MPDLITRQECSAVKEGIKDSIDRLGKQIQGQARDTNEALRTIVMDQREIKEKLDSHIGFHKGGEHTMETRYQASGVWAKWGATILAVVAAVVAATLFVASTMVG